MITFNQKGDYKKVTKYLNDRKDISEEQLNIIRGYAIEGILALKQNTPVDTGKTASSWYCKIFKENGRVTLQYCNSNINDNVPIAIILQYGHGTGTGGWVEGRDYINPSIQPVFDRITEKAWKEVTG